MDKEAVVYIYNGILHSHKNEQIFLKKKQIWVSSSEVDEPTACYTEWSKSEGEKQIYINAYIWNLEKWYWWIYFSDTENRLMDTTRQGESGKNWESSIETYTLPCVKLILLNCGAGETLESPLDCKEMKPVNHKGVQS